MDDGPGEESQHSSDAGEPRLLESSHRALSDGLGGFVNPSDIRALRVVLDRAERLDVDGSYRYRVTGARPGVLRFIN